MNESTTRSAEVGGSAGSWATRHLLLRARLGGAVEGLRRSSSGLVVLSLVVGVGAAGFAVAFRWLIGTFTVAITGQQDYAAVAGAPRPGMEGLGRWFLLLTPVVAGLLYGPLVHFFAREARGHGVPEVMFAVARRAAASVRRWPV